MSFSYKYGKRAYFVSLKNVFLNCIVFNNLQTAFRIERHFYVFLMNSQPVALKEAKSSGKPPFCAILEVIENKEFAKSLKTKGYKFLAFGAAICYTY